MRIHETEGLKTLPAWSSVSSYLQSKQDQSRTAGFTNKKQASKARIREYDDGFFRAYIGWWNKQHEPELELRRHRPRSPLPSRLTDLNHRNGGSYRVDDDDGGGEETSNFNVKQWRWIFPLLTSTSPNFLLDLWNSNHLPGWLLWCYIKRENL